MLNVKDYMVCKYCGSVVHIVTSGLYSSGVCSNPECGGYWTFMPTWKCDYEVKMEVVKDRGDVIVD